MPRPCHPYCNEKRDFMEINPPRAEADFYKNYDPSVGIGIMLTLCIFFFIITIKSCVRYSIRKWQMYKFYKSLKEDNKDMEKEQNQNVSPSIEVT